MSVRRRSIGGIFLCFRGAVVWLFISLLGLEIVPIKACFPTNCQNISPRFARRQLWESITKQLFIIFLTLLDIIDEYMSYNNSVQYYMLNNFIDEVMLLNSYLGRNIWWSGPWLAIRSINKHVIIFFPLFVHFIMQIHISFVYALNYFLYFYDCIISFYVLIIIKS